MTDNKTKTPFAPLKKSSPFVVDPYNNRGQKGGKKGQALLATPGKKAAKTVNVAKPRGGSGGDR
jgi:hypothetical protein